MEFKLERDPKTDWSKKQATLLIGSDHARGIARSVNDPNPGTHLDIKHSGQASRKNIDRSYAAGEASLLNQFPDKDPVHIKNNTLLKALGSMRGVIHVLSSCTPSRAAEVSVLEAAFNKLEGDVTSPNTNQNPSELEKELEILHKSFNLKLLAALKKADLLGEVGDQPKKLEELLSYYRYLSGLLDPAPVLSTKIDIDESSYYIETCYPMTKKTDQQKRDLEAAIPVDRDTVPDHGFYAEMSEAFRKATWAFRKQLMSDDTLPSPQLRKYIPYGLRNAWTEHREFFKKGNPGSGERDELIESLWSVRTGTLAYVGKGEKSTAEKIARGLMALFLFSGGVVLFSFMLKEIITTALSSWLVIGLLAAAALILISVYRVVKDFGKSSGESWADMQTAVNENLKQLKQNIHGIMQQKDPKNAKRPIQLHMTVLNTDMWMDNMYANGENQDRMVKMTQEALRLESERSGLEMGFSNVPTNIFGRLFYWFANISGLAGGNVSTFANPFNPSARMQQAAELQYVLTANKLAPVDSSTVVTVNLIGGRTLTISGIVSGNIEYTDSANPIPTTLAPPPEGEALSAEGVVNDVLNTVEVVSDSPSLDPRPIISDQGNLATLSQQDKIITDREKARAIAAVQNVMTPPTPPLVVPAFTCASGIDRTGTVALMVSLLFIMKGLKNGRLFREIAEGETLLGERDSNLIDMQNWVRRVLDLTERELPANTVQKIIEKLAAAGHSTVMADILCPSSPGMKRDSRPGKLLGHLANYLYLESAERNKETPLYKVEMKKARKNGLRGGFMLMAVIFTSLAIAAHQNAQLWYFWFSIPFSPVLGPELLFAIGGLFIWGISTWVRQHHTKDAVSASAQTLLFWGLVGCGLGLTGLAIHRNLFLAIWQPLVNSTLFSPVIMLVVTIGVMSIALGLSGRKLCERMAEKAFVVRLNRLSEEPIQGVSAMTGIFAVKDSPKESDFRNPETPTPKDTKKELNANPVAAVEVDEESTETEKNLSPDV